MVRLFVSLIAFSARVLWRNIFSMLLRHAILMIASVSHWQLLHTLINSDSIIILKLLGCYYARDLLEWLKVILSISVIIFKLLLISELLTILYITHTLITYYFTILSAVFIIIFSYWRFRVLS